MAALGLICRSGQLPFAQIHNSGDFLRARPPSFGRLARDVGDVRRGTMDGENPAAGLSRRSGLDFVVSPQLYAAQALARRVLPANIEEQ